jgi:hypothetical protein
MLNQTYGESRQTNTTLTADYGLAAIAGVGVAGVAEKRAGMADHFVNNRYWGQIYDAIHYMLLSSHFVDSLSALAHSSLRRPFAGDTASFITGR